jgi:hypothetical protein
MMDKKLDEIIKRTRAYDREIKIEKILGDDEVKTPNQKFIMEIRDHLSTCINRSEFISSSYFNITSDMADIQTCNCHTHIETEKAFEEFLKVLYSMYKGSEGFNVNSILNKKVVERIKNNIITRGTQE